MLKNQVSFLKGESALKSKSFTGVATTEEFDHEYIPSPSSRSRKLLVVFHGLGDSVKPFRSLLSELRLKNFHLLLLNAPRKYGKGFSWYRLEPRETPDVLKNRRKIKRLFDELIEQGWKTTDIYLFGFSQGCLVATDWALHSPYPLGGLIGVSGYFYKHSRPSLKSPHRRKTPWLMTHGLHDRVLKIEETKKRALHLKSKGLSLDWVELTKGHTLDEHQDLPIIRRWLKEKSSAAI